jgi:hypothetical protein
LQQLKAFASGGTMPAELETAAVDLDFSASAEEKNAQMEPRSNSRSKTFQINWFSTYGDRRKNSASD